jgi:hypothetical protein
MAGCWLWDTLPSGDEYNNYGRVLYMRFQKATELAEVHSVDNTLTYTAEFLKVFDHVHNGEVTFNNYEFI